MQTYKEAVILKFPHHFSALGKLEGAYTIALNDDAKPFALTTPRRIAIPVLPKVKAELQQMTWESFQGLMSPQIGVQGSWLCQNQMVESGVQFDKT